MLQNCDLAAMQASAPDELLFIEHATPASRWSFLAGYGPPFWLLINAIFGTLTFDVAVPMARGLFIVMKYAAWLLLFGIVLKRNARAAVLFLFLVLLTPGYFFFGKIISPEYLLLLLSALCLWCLDRDKAAFGPAYLAALLFASLATATKVSAAPLLVVTCAASIVYPLWAGHGVQTAVRHGLKAGALLASFWLPLAWLCSPPKAWAQLSHALSIVPPVQFNRNVLWEAWSRDAVTWDQIMVGGLGKDFVAICGVSMIAAVITLTAHRRQEGHGQGLAWLALLSGGLMLTQAATHQSAYAWYVFLPLQMLAFGACLVLATQASSKGIALCSVIVLLCFAIHDARRIDTRLRYKLQSNAMVSSSRMEMAALESALKVEHPCANIGHADILIPLPSPSVIPMRTSLNHRTTGQWREPDFLVLNERSMIAPMHSGLATLVELEAFNNFEFRKRVGGLGLYVRKNLGC